MSKDSDVEAELAALKSGSSQPQNAIEGADSTPAATAQEERQKEEGQA
jgi:hypothetical protein